MAYKIINNWIPESKYHLKSAQAMQPKGLVVHNTSGSQTALGEVQYMINNNTNVSFHVAIDEINVVQALPFTRVAHHAGNWGANTSYIGVEIARSKLTDGKYEAAEANAIEYIAHVFIQYNWGMDRLHFHREFTATACPERITGATKEKAFKDKVAAKIAEIKKGGNTPNENVSKPPVNSNGGLTLNDTTRSEADKAIRKAVKEGTFNSSNLETLDKGANDEFLLNRALTLLLREYNK